MPGLVAIDSLPVTERGYAVAKSGDFWSLEDLERTPELRWPRSVPVYDAMRRQDAQVISVLRAVGLPIIRTPWRLDPTGCRDEVVELVSEDLGLPIKGFDAPPDVLRTKARFSWDEHLRLVLTMLPFGHSYFEPLYTIDGEGRGTRARLRKLAWRPPSTIEKFNVADDGGLISIEQYATGTRKGAVIPVEYLVAYVNEREGGNWAGQSLLRAAYKFWLLKDRGLRVQAQGLDRNGLGLPVFTAGDYPEDMDAEERQSREKEEMSRGAAMAAAVRVGDNTGVGLRYGSKLELTGVSGKIPDAEPVIRYYDEQIARAVLAHFLNLGTQTGSWALGSTFADFFTLSLQTVAKAIGSVSSAHVVEDMVDYNFGPNEPAPKVVWDEIGASHPATAEAMKILVEAKILTPDEPLEQHARTIYGLPAADPSSARQPPAAAAPAVPAAPQEEAA